MKPPRALSPRPDEAMRSGDRLVVRLVLLAAAVWIALAIYGLFFPSAFNWGIHQLAFVPRVEMLILLAALAATLLPPVSRWLLEHLQGIASGFRGMPTPLKALVFLLMLAAASMLFWTGREATFLLGDGNLVARTLPTLRNAENIPLSSFQNEPLATYIVWQAYRFLEGSGVAEANVRAYQWTSILFGAGAILTVIMLVRLLVADPLERLLVGLAIIASAGTELFFGYVESYAGLAFGTLLFLTLSLYALRKDLSPLFASIAFGALLALHIGMASMGPLLLYLVIVVFRRDGWRPAVAAMAAAIVSASFFFWISGFRPSTLASLLQGGGDHFLPLLQATTNGHAYTLFSAWHLSDVANLFLLLSPFSLLGVGLVAAAFFRRRVVWDRTWSFLTIGVFCSLLFTFTINCALGMSRDWDLLSSFGLSLVVAAPVACARWITDAVLRKRALLVVAIVSLASAIPWFALNAGEGSSLQRFEMLPERALWSRNAYLNAYDELATFHKGRKEYTQALEYCGLYLASDSNNARMYGKMGEIYGLLGEKERELSYYGQSLRHGTKNWKLALYVGSGYASLRRYTEAIAFTSQGLDWNPAQADQWYILGSYYVNGPADFASALGCFQRSISVDSTDARPYADAGRCAYLLGDMEGMRRYFGGYARRTSHPLDQGTIQALLAPLTPELKRRAARARP